jgi:UDP-N-acetylglucosamine 3-dehydrogenase
MPEHTRVGVAVVGVGNMGRHHARIYHGMTETRLKAVVDTDLARAREIADRYDCDAFASVDEMLSRDVDVDAVSVAVSTARHYEVASRLLEAGKHVLVEKPIADTITRAKRLVALAERSSRTLAVGHVERFNPVVRELRARIERGDLGQLVSLSARRLGLAPPQVQDANVVLDIAVHDIDVFRYLLGANRPRQVFCSAGKALVLDRYDFADIFLQFDDVGCLLQVNWLTPVKIRSLTASGTRGYVELDYVTQRMDFHHAQPMKEPASFRELENYSRILPERIEFQRAEPLELELREFIRSATGFESEIVSGEDAIASLEIVGEILAVAEQEAAKHPARDRDAHRAEIRNPAVV